MKRALVLCGGGAKGAYEAGVYKALQQANLQFDIVVGTSIGALNGALIAQGDIREMIDLWENLELDQVMNEGINFDLNFDAMYEQREQFPKFIKSYITSKGADTEPLRQRIRSMANPKKIKRRGITYGCICVRFPSLEPVYMTLDDMQEDEYAEWLIASSACFPAFPVQTINGQNYIDGGYFDNMPIQFAYSLGATEIIAVDLFKETHPEYISQPDITYIRPSEDIGFFLNFENERFKKVIDIGYRDGLKAVGLAKGHKYTFYNSTWTRLGVQKTLQPFLDAIHRYDMEATRQTKYFIKPNSLSPTLTVIKNAIGEYTDKSEYLIAISELAGTIFRMDHTQIYHYHTFLKQLKKSVKEKQMCCQLTFEASNLSELKTQIASLDEQQVVLWAMNQLQSETPNNKQMQWMSALYPKSMAAALFLTTLS
ncbi:MAG: patatin-like phospholipase family protein [Erysipelotrichaceae bacterium]|nr:patatin-like phospholipase family protein [Erysipelotrichaceae bacterium]